MKSDEELSHIWLLKRWIAILREAKSDYERRLERQAKRPNPGDPIISEDEAALPEPLMVRFEPVSRDMWNFLLQSLERAAKGNRDPFGLRMKHRDPKLPREKRIEAVAEVLRLHHKGTPLEEARATVGAKKGVSDETIKKWFADDDTLSAAVSAVVQERFPKTPWTAEDATEFLTECNNVMGWYRRRR